MSNVLIIAEHQEGKLRKVTLPTITFGQQARALYGGELYVLVLGADVAAVAAECAKFDVDGVYTVDDPSLANYLAENWAPVIVAAAEELEAEILATPATTTGKDFMPRVAGKLACAQVSDAIAIFEGDEGTAYKRPIWAGNVLVTVVPESDNVCVTVRTTAFDEPKAGSAEVEALDLEVEAFGNTEFVSFDMVKSDRPDLTDAAVVVAGGRGLKASENFGMLEELADLLNGAVGATRAAVDSGMAPNDWQIGQTGKIVAPNLYFAIAISGAIQHLAGMKNSKTIVAINKDAEAPIFQVADYGLVADAFDVIPELNEAIREMKE